MRYCDVSCARQWHTHRGTCAKGGESGLVRHCALFAVARQGVGHIRKERECVTQLVSPASVFMLPATLLTITPEPFGESGDTYGEQAQTSDLVISRRSLEKALEAAASRRDVPKSEYLTGLVLRTLPNDASKKNRTYSGANPAYFTREAMQWMRTQRVRHLVCDLPSVDREDDGGFMRAHSTFWGVDCETSEGPEMALDRRSCSITELAFVDPSYSLEDGPYALSLQLAPFLMDATPSRPLLLPLRSE